MVLKAGTQVRGLGPRLPGRNRADDIMLLHSRVYDHITIVHASFPENGSHFSTSILCPSMRIGICSCKVIMIWPKKPSLPSD